MSEVFLCQNGQLTSRSRSDLRKAGIVVVEVEDTSACKFIRSTEVLDADDLLFACLGALNHRGKGYGNDGANQREHLADELFRLTSKAREVGLS